MFDFLNNWLWAFNCYLHGIWGAVSLAVLILAFVALFVWFYKTMLDNNKNALNTLKQRYAAGEIDTDEFEMMKRKLE
jgi:uncharacterized membrane protein